MVGMGLKSENCVCRHDPFVIPDDVYKGWNAKESGAKAESDWNVRFDAYAAAFPELAAEFKRRVAGDLPADWSARADEYIKSVDAAAASPATRQASQKSIEAYAAVLPEFLGGSADLAPSNLTLWSNSKALTNTESDANYIHYGVREFAMSAIMNGVTLHGGLIPFGATFLMFSEYARNALRMAALMKIRTIFVYTHDSIGLGEDGPTHQPVEQIATLRLIPNMAVWRPCDAVESAVSWKSAVERKDGPSCLIFSRQGLPHQARSSAQIVDIARGGYVLSDCEGTADAIIISTGSEVGLAVDAAAQLTASGKKIRIVSMPCEDIFSDQDDAYKESVLPAAITARVAVEAGVTDAWHKYVGLNGKVIGIDRFGESAPAGDLFKYFGFTVENVVKAVEDVL